MAMHIATLKTIDPALLSVVTVVDKITGSVIVELKFSPATRTWVFSVGGGA